MILKVDDILKSLRRTDPDCKASRDLTGLYLLGWPLDLYFNIFFKKEDFKKLPWKFKI